MIFSKVKGELQKFKFLKRNNFTLELRDYYAK
jgi:hypothetical protein